MYLEIEIDSTFCVYECDVFKVGLEDLCCEQTANIGSRLGIPGCHSLLNSDQGMIGYFETSALLLIGFISCGAKLWLLMPFDSSYPTNMTVSPSCLMNLTLKKGKHPSCPVIHITLHT